MIEWTLEINQMQCQYYPQRKRARNGNQLGNKKLQNNERMKNSTVKALQFMEQERKRMEH